MWVHSRRTYLAGCLVLVVILAIGVALWLKSSKSCDLSLPQGCISLEYASTPAAQQQGLSGRNNLPATQAMLFAYDTPGKRCLWMKDMRFSLDMVWLDADKRIIAIESDIAPATYPDSFCFEGAQYVLELLAGAVAQNQLAVGQQLNF